MEEKRSTANPNNPIGTANIHAFGNRNGI